MAGDGFGGVKKTYIRNPAISFFRGISKIWNLENPCEVKDPLAQMRERLEAQRANAGNAPKYQAFGFWL